MNTASLSLANLPRKREAGVAAIEFALLLPILIVFLLFPIFLSKCLWHYTVAQKAAQDAARYLSTVSRSEMLSRTLAEEAANRAVAIAERELTELAPSSGNIQPYAYCDTLNCGNLNIGSVPTTVRVRLSFAMSDPLGLFDFGWYGLVISADHTLPYVGN